MLRTYAALRSLACRIGALPDLGNALRGISYQAGTGPDAPPRRDDVMPGNAVLEVFDRSLKRAQRDRAAVLAGAGGAADTDPLLALASERLLDRLEDCTRRFPTTAVIGGAAHHVVPRLAGGRAGVERVVVVDSSEQQLSLLAAAEVEARAEAAAAQAAGAVPPRAWPAMHYLLGDDELLPLAPGSMDLVIACLGLHWANDLPGVLAQCRAALKPDGLLLAAMFGGQTLQELRISCAAAAQERQGGISAVVSPMAQVRDAGNLLTRAGLAMPSVDVDEFALAYASPLDLVHHLRCMGEVNASHQRQRVLRRDNALAAAALYHTMFPAAGATADGHEQEGQAGQAKQDAGAGVTATYQVMFMTGWAPAPHQPRAARRGSATVSFHDLATGLVGQGASGGSADGPEEDAQPQPQAGRRSS